LDYCPGTITDDLTIFPGTGRFRPIGVVGRGAMGIVYRVHDAEMQTDVALKTFTTPGPEEAYRLKQEFRTLAGIRHQNLVELYELVVTDAHCFFTMELVDGVSFIEHVRGAESALFDDAARARLMAAARQVVDGVAALHAAGVLHRDVKPSNVLVTRTGRVVVLDFGLALDVRRERGDGEFAGTIAYMAPEQAWGRSLSSASDWYAFGAMLYEAIAGRLPFEGPRDRVLLAKTRGVPPSLAPMAESVPERLQVLVSELLAPEADRRPSVQAIRAALESAATARADLSAPLLGRDRELARLAAAYATVRRGHAMLVHVSAPSGMGKTELLSRFVSDLERHEATWALRGRCRLQETVPYKGFDAVVDGLARKLMAVADEEATSLVPEDAGALARVFPVLRRVPAFAAANPPDEGAELYEVRRRAFRTLRELLTRIGRRWPLVLWIDDLQWSDADSTLLLQELLRAPEPPPALVLLSYRRDDRGPVLAELEALDVQLAVDHVEHIELAPLDPISTRALAELLCAGVVDREDRIGEIVTEAAGSPFLIGELGRYLALGSIVHRDLRTPARLEDAINDRARRLPAETRRVLELVSVAGHPLERSFLLRAAGVGERGRPVVAALADVCLVRTSVLEGRTVVEPYHDRIGEALVGGLAPAVLVARHGALADVWLSHASPDAEAVFRHCLGAGRREQAGDWAVRAAERAAAALAFARAAELYRTALDVKRWDDDRTARLQTELAEALVNAGRGSEAAPVYIDAASRRAGLPGIDLRRRAAEQFMVSGHLDRGTAVVRELLADVGLRYPRAPATALGGAVGRLAEVAARSAQASHWGRQADARDRTRVDTCHSIAKGLVLVDPPRGLYFAVRALALALKARDAERTAREFAAVGAALLPAGGVLTAWARRMVARARAMAERTGDPYLLGFTSIALAQERMVDARWPEMLELVDQGLQLLRARCRGVSWELNIGAMAAARALEDLGRIEEASRRSAEQLRDAEARGDLYGIYVGLVYSGVCLLAQSDSAGARADAARILELWTGGDLHMQHFYAYRIDAYADVFEGQAAAAWDRVERFWTPLRRSGLLRHSLIRLDALVLRGRSALALASTNAGNRESLARIADHCARHLSRERRPDALGHVRLLLAATASLRNQRSRAIALLRDAEHLFAGAGMQLCAALTQWRAGELCGGDAGRDHVREACDALVRLGVRNPARLVATYAPGFPELTTPK
jgi:hypothetical protein